MKKNRRKASSKELQDDGVSLLGSSPSPPPSPYYARGKSSHHGDDSHARRRSHGDESQSMESSLPFERTSLPPENRFAPQHDPKENIRRVPRTGALQFVPAYEESTTPAIPNPAMEEEPPPTWDAIIEADNGRGRSLSWSRKPKIHHSKSRSAERSISSVGSYGGSGIFRRKAHAKPRGSPVRSAVSPSKRPLGTAVPRPSLSPVKQRPVARTSKETASVVSAASSTWKGTRIARLKTLFSSREAVAKGEEDLEAPLSESKEPLMRKNVPPSPARSSRSDSSSGYVGWPGTQDKRGVTTAIQSSYDDSSVGAAAFSRKKYELEQDDAAVEQEVRKWMGDQSFDESTVSEKMTPLERRFENDNSFQSGGVTEESYDEDENPADYHLAAVVADAVAAARSPLAENKKSPLKKSRRQANDIRSLRSSPKAGLHGYSGRPRSTKSASGRPGGSSLAATSASGALSIHNLFGDGPLQDQKASLKQEMILQTFNDDPWDVDSSSRPPSSTGTSVSKSSSAFFQTKDVSESKYGIRPNMRGASSVVRNNPESSNKSSPPKPEMPQPPTKVALAMNDRLSPTPRGINARNVPGFRGYLDKTKEVPNLIDDMDSESATSSRATSAYTPVSRRPIGRISPAGARDSDSASDVFDGLSTAETDIFSQLGVETIHEDDRKSGKQKRVVELKGPQLIRLPGGLTAIQTTQSDLDRRKKADDFDENLTNSEVDQFGYAKLPAFREMAAAGRKGNDTAKYMPPVDSSRALSPPGHPTNIRPPIKNNTKSRSMFETTLSVDESDASLFSENARFGTLRGYYAGDLSEYCVNPRQVKQLVKRYRQLCPPESAHLTDEEFEKEEDAKKAFALLEMRSRVMEKDIERGLERQGGTVPVDDLVTTLYNQAAHRIRDAVIVSKAWRDGASPKDVITASILTRTEERTYYVKRPVRYRGGRSPLSRLNDSMSIGYYLEPVGWVDDTDFMQLRCPSLGPRCMRGFEMFTIGDCQSILLKLTNEQCMDLRAELNEATSRQLEAEEFLKEEGDGGDGIMTEAEMTYLTSMEEVKTISKRLVVAEKAFAWVRDRIQKLVAKYETLLVKIENDSAVGGAPSSILTSGTSYYSDDENSQYSSEDDREKVMLTRRARRAELRAEVAAREAYLAKQEAQMVREEKQRELKVLQQKLTEMQEESSTAIAEKEKSVMLAKAIAHETPSAVLERGGTPRISQQRINDVKQKFRARMAHRNRSSPTSSQQSSPRRSPPAPERPPERPFPTPTLNSRLRMTAGEEMFQHLDFYERSLKAVDNARAGTR